MPKNTGHGHRIRWVEDKQQLETAVFQAEARAANLYIFAQAGDVRVFYRLWGTGPFRENTDTGFTPGTCLKLFC